MGDFTVMVSSDKGTVELVSWLIVLDYEGWGMLMFDLRSGRDMKAGVDLQTYLSEQQIASM